MNSVLLLILTSLAMSNVSARGFKKPKRPSIPRPQIPVIFPGYRPPNTNPLMFYGHGPGLRPLTRRPTTTTPAPNSLTIQLMSTILNLNEASFQKEISEIKKEMRNYVNQTDQFRDMDPEALSTIIKLLANEEVGGVLIPLVKILRERENLEALDDTSSLLREQKAHDLAKQVFRIKHLHSELRPAMTRFYCAFNEQNDRITAAIASIVEENRGKKTITPQNAAKAISISKRISKLVKPFQDVFESNIFCSNTNVSPKSGIGMENAYYFALFLMHSLFPEPEPVIT